MKTSEILSELKHIASIVSPSIEDRKFVRQKISDEKFARFFFEQAEGPEWIDELRILFQSNRSDNPFSGYPYLFRLHKENYEEFVDLVRIIEKRLDYYGFNRLMKIAVSIQPENAVKLNGIVEHYLSTGIRKSAGGLIDYLKHIFIPESDNEQLWSILNKVLYFLSDPESEDKRQRKQNDPDDWTTSLEPAIRINAYEYQEILEEGIRPLADKNSYQIAHILINATSSMIKLSIHQEPLDNGGYEDFSEIWCRRLNKPDSDYQDIKATLVHTLTYACEKVHEKSPNSVGSLDEKLRNQRWELFKRLRQHLYALNPNEQTLPWVREFILEHEDYAEWDHHFEFQLMIRKACEHFGTDLISEKERTPIFEAILSGPSRKKFREWMGDQFTDEKYQIRQRYFQRKQLRPFSSLLTGKYQSYYQELESEFEKEPLSDEDYSPVGESEGGIVSNQSPRSLEDLAKFSDLELLEYINEWQEERYNKDDLLIEINIEALARTYQTLFKDTIISNKVRLAYWWDNRGRIQRPIYVKAIVQALQEHVKEQRSEQFSPWFEFCEWVLTHPDADNENDISVSDKSREYPDWSSARRAVGDFLGACLGNDVYVPFTARESLAKLLRMMCTQFDRRLERHEPVLLNRDDHIMEAINNTRSRALQDLMNFIPWVLDHNKSDSVPEVTAILEERIKANAEYPLTLPEHAILGLYYSRLCRMNRHWAVEQKVVFFPQDNIQIWREAFGSFLRFNNPLKVSFEILKDDYAFSLDHLSVFKGMKRSGRELTDRLGQHLFSYYLWKYYPLRGENSLLEKFYEKTNEDRQRWAILFDHVGRSLRNSGKHLKEDLKNRIVAFFDWRLEAKEPQELQEFTFWLEAECLAAEWRLNAYSRVLGIINLEDEGTTNLKGMNVSIGLKTLRKLLKDHTAVVVECLAKITDSRHKSTIIYVPSDEIKPILKVGIESNDAIVKENAERARENLLKMGQFEFLNPAGE